MTCWVEPVSEYGVQNHQHDAHRPGNRIEHEDSVNRVVVRKNQLNAENSEEAEGNQQHCHRRNAFSRSSDGSCQSVKDAQQPVERTEVVHGLLPVGHNHRIVGEEAHNRVGEEQNQGSGDDGVDDSDPQSLVHPLLHPVQLSGTEILSGEGGNRHADAHHRKDVESIDLQVSPEAGHRRCPESVDTGLHQHVGDGDDRVLNSRRKTHLDNPDAHHLVEADFLQGDLIGLIRLQQEAHGEQLQEDIDGLKLYTVLDARATEQYDLTHAPGAWSTPCRKGDDYDNAYNAILSPEARKDNFKEVVEKNPNAIFAIICYSGTRYSNNAKETLMKDFGIPEERIIVQRGGMSKWNGTVVSAPKVDVGAGTVTIATKVNKALESNPQMKTGTLVASESGTRKEESVLRTYVTPKQMSEAMTELKAKAGKNEVCASVQWNDFRKTGGGTLPEILNNLEGQPAMLYAAESNDRNSETGEIAALTSDSDALFGIPNRPATEDNLCTVKSGALPKSDHEMSASFSPDEHNVVYLTFTLK